MKGRDGYDDGFSERLEELELLEKRERNEKPKPQPTPKKEEDKCIHDKIEDEMKESGGYSDKWVEYVDDPEPYPDIGEEYQDDKERWDENH